jgi:Caspase domain
LQWPVAAGIVALIVAIGGGVYYRNSSGGQGGQGDQDANVEKPPVTSVASSKEPVKPVDLPKAAMNFPRRFLAVCIHNYLYANPVSARGDRTGMTDVLRMFAKDKLRTDPSQIYVLSDAVAGKEARAPVKQIIEQTVERFLATCRRQDRIMIVFVGHAVDLDDQPYLVPLEGELAVKESLIPLKWLYDRLATCPARQKVLVMDVCRDDTARGNERPGSGPMGPKLDAALANPPAGVQVLTACVGKQFSHEYDYASIGNNDVRGGAFLSLLTQAPRTKWGLPKPEEPLPVMLLVDRVKEPLTQLVAARDKVEQTVRLTGAEPADPGEGAAYVADSPLPARFELPRPAALAEGGLADPQLIRGIFGEIAMPPLKMPRDADHAGQAEEEAAKLAAIVPFRAESLKGYEPDYANIRQLLDKPKEYPLRVAVVQAVEAIDKAKLGLREEFKGPTSDDVKKDLTDTQKEGPAKLLLSLSETLEKLEAVAGERSKEKSKRWLAHYDYVTAQVKARMVYVSEYNLLLAKVKKEELPPLDPKLHNGYRLASQEKIQSPKEIKDLASESRKLLTKLIKENPGTPWELLAKRERFTALGLAWQPANLGQ